METFLDVFVQVIVILGIIYLSFFLGYGNYKKMRAVVFIGKISVKNKQAKIKVSACNGFLKRVLWLKKNSQYEFTLTSNSSSGNISVEILDKNKERVVLLDSINQTVLVNTKDLTRHYLVFHFKNATGELELTWKTI